jgi:predicted dehydrogenase
VSQVEAVKWGIISTARINSKIVRGAAGSPLVEIAGVASRQLARAEAAARSWGLQCAYGSYEALLADEEIEAVYVSLPNSLHSEWSERALEAGKHVLCEKPLSRHPAEVEALFDQAERRGLILSEAFMYRHHPQTGRLSQLVAQGAIGELRLVRATFSFTLTDPRNIRLRPELDGGALLDVGCYCLSAARLLAGEPLSVYAEAWFGPSGTDWVCAGTLRFPREVIAVFDCGTALPPRDELEAIGSDGSLFLDDPWRGVEAGIEYRRGGASEQIAVEPADPYRLELENLSAAIRGRAVPLLGRDDALGQARALDALMRSARTGVPVSL